MTEPLSQDRDEVLYLVCTHPRVKIRGSINEDRAVEVVRAKDFGPGDFVWEQSPWARLTLPEHMKLSRVPWSVLDSALETVEGLEPVGFNPQVDPDGWDGRHRQELLAWIFDRHLEATSATSSPRGTVEGGFLDFRLEYVGRSKAEALRRATGAHHKLPLILNKTLVYEPGRLAYVLPSEPRMVTYDPVDRTSESTEALRLESASEALKIERELLTAASEEMLIAWLGAPYNRSSTQGRRFPNSASAKLLKARGFTEAGIGFVGLPEMMRISGTSAATKHPVPIHRWNLP